MWGAGAGAGLGVGGGGCVGTEADTHGVGSLVPMGNPKSTKPKLLNNKITVVLIIHNS